MYGEQMQAADDFARPVDVEILTVPTAAC